MAREPLKLLCLDLTPIDNRQQLQSEIGAMRGMWNVRFDPCKPTRSHAQNAFAHGVIFTMLAKEMREQGNDQADLDYAKSYLKDKYLRIEVTHPETGEIIGHIVRETHKLNIEDMSRFIENCIAHCADFWNLPIPDPGEHIIARLEKQHDPR